VGEDSPFCQSTCPTSRRQQTDKGFLFADVWEILCPSVDILHSGSSAVLTFLFQETQVRKQGLQADLRTQKNQVRFFCGTKKTKKVLCFPAFPSSWTCKDLLVQGYMEGPVNLLPLSAVSPPTHPYIHTSKVVTNNMAGGRHKLRHFWKQVYLICSRDRI
jgi:hypothetical protein